MTRRRLVTLVAASAVLIGAVGIARLAELGPFAGSGDARPPQQVSLGGASAREGVTLHMTPRAPEPARPRQPVHVDVARVEAALARLERATAQITPEQLAVEQRRMLEAKARFEAVQIAEPKIRKFTDDHGTRWIELQHPSGELRYQLDPDDDEPGSGSNR
jgi:hypothetical protein